jgi:hypothetical protein
VNVRVTLPNGTAPTLRIVLVAPFASAAVTVSESPADAATVAVKLPPAATAKPVVTALVVSFFTVTVSWPPPDTANAEPATVAVVAEARVTLTREASTVGARAAPLMTPIPCSAAA